MEECLLLNIFPTGCPHGQEGEGGSAKCRQLQTEGGGHQKSLKMCRHPLWMAANEKVPFIDFLSKI